MIRYSHSVGPAHQYMMGGTEQPEYIETAGQTWKAGSLIHVVAAGTLSICTNSSQILNSEVGGQAMAAATGTTDATVRFRPILPTDVFLANVYHTVAASAVTAQTDLGDIRGLYYVTATGLWHVDGTGATILSGDVANETVRIVGFPGSVDGTVNTIGDIYGFVFVQFLSLSVATDGNPTRRVLQFA